MYTSSSTEQHVLVSGEIQVKLAMRGRGARLYLAGVGWWFLVIERSVKPSQLECERAVLCL